MNTATLRTVQRAAFLGLASAFVDMFHLSTEWKRIIETGDWGEKKENSTLARWRFHAYSYDFGYTQASWSVTFKDPMLGNAHIIADEMRPVAFTWSRGSWDFEEKLPVIARLDFGITADHEPLENEIFLQVLEALRVEFYRYLRRHAMPLRSPSTKVFTPSSR